MTLMADEQPERINRFELIERLGTGSQGSVYLAWDPTLERRVAIKILHIQPTPNPRADLAPSEGRIAGKLSHPNIVPVYEAGSCDGRPYLVFEHVRGRTVRALLERDGAFSVARTCALMAPILEGIAHAHERGVIHLDLSPGNIIVDETDVPRIMDFGLARFAQAPRGPGACLEGTLRYMAPEHFNGRLGAHTDVYALCLIMYEMVVGKPARHALASTRVMTQIVSGEIDMQPLGVDPAGQRLAGFLEGGLEKDPKARYADGQTLLEAFRTTMADEAGKTAATVPADRRHSTVGFLLRRMKRRGDFPALSSSIVAISQATSDESKGSSRQLSRVILRDYALTQKVLQLANSAYYGRRGAGNVSNVSQAVSLLGLRQIRLAAYGVTFFEHFRAGGGSEALIDALVRAFATGLITRHLAKESGIAGVEEAFICGLFHNLGEHLVLHYFPEEHAEIRTHMMDRGLSRNAASRAVLGLTYGDLGYAVVKHWKFPETIANTITEPPNDVISAPNSTEDHLRYHAAFANEICLIPGSKSPALARADLASLAARFEPSSRMSVAAICRLLEATLEKLGEFTPIFGFDVAETAFSRGVQTLVAYDDIDDAYVDSDSTTVNPAARLG